MSKRTCWMASLEKHWLPLAPESAYLKRKKKAAK